MNLSKEREAEIRTRHRNGTDACDTCHLLAALDAERERVKALEKAHAESVRLFNWFRQGIHPLESSQKWLAEFEPLARAAKEQSR